MSVRGSYSTALRPVPRVPGSRGLAMRDRPDEAPRRSHWIRAGTVKARLLARAASLLQIVSKGVES